MLSEPKIERLLTHISAIFNQIILPDISPDGFILAADNDGNVFSDNVTTHHLVEFCIELNRSLTNELIHSAINWFFKTQNNASNPFFVSSTLSSDFIKPEQKIEISKSVCSNQRESGFIDLYAGFLDGGNIFSTLWAIKILILAGKDDNKEQIKKAFYVIDKSWNDIHRTSFKGFYLEQLIKFGELSGLKHTISSVRREIVNEQNENKFWDNSHFYTPYVLGNLCVTKATKAQETAVTKAIEEIFDLNKEKIEFPQFLIDSKEKYEDSAFIQISIRCLISAIRYLRLYHDIEASQVVASGMFGLFPKIYQSARAIDAERKKMVRQYGEIREHYEHLERVATEKLLSESEYEKNIFVMMPFRHDIDDRYEAIVEILKLEFEKYGFKAWLASDKNIRPQLWDNVASFMLACKYGIAVFTRVEKEHRIKIDEFNPNVSLELGFFISRGKKVLLLKDQALPKLPTDLVGHLYHEFELNRVKKQLPGIIKQWVGEITDDQSKAEN